MSCEHNTGTLLYIIIPQGGAVVQRVESWTRDQQAWVLILKAA